MWYQISRLTAMAFSKALVRLRVLRPEVARRKGAWILASNHISHFDPPLISVACGRKVDWMGMVELFQQPVVAGWLMAIGTFPVDRGAMDRRAVREAVARLKMGRVVGIFPEGGIRDGAGSALEGAPLRPGVAALARMTGAPVVPCVIVGTDRGYVYPRLWRPGWRMPVWIAFGQPLEAKRGQGREELERALSRAFQELGAEVRARYGLTADDWPQSPKRRRAETR